MCCKNKDNSFSDLGNPNQIWAIPSIHADINRLTALHDAIFDKIQAGDRLVYLGNYTGYGTEARETIDELLTFRRMLLAKPAMKPTDIIYLRGQQEDLWGKLLQIQFHPTPVNALIDLIGKGLGPTMQSYGICPHDGITAAKEGMYSLNKWTNHIRQKLRAHEGHDCFLTQHRRAAYTTTNNSNSNDQFPLLFVNTGIDTSKSLQEQKSNFWENSAHFDKMTESYAPFDKVVRGFDPAHKGLHLNCITATLDAGCGFGGPLICAQMSAQGEFHEVLEA